jgi:hypothetical protein
MKKTKLLLASLFFILLGIAFSCKVDLESLGEPIDTESNNLLNRARISFEERLKNDPILKKYKIEPIWDNAISYKNTVEVSFKMDGRIYRPSIVKNQKNSGRAKLLLTEKGSKFSIVIAHYIPSILYKGKIGSITSQNLKTNNFDGIVSMEELESDKKTNFHFINGKVVKKTYVFDKNKTKKSGRTQICTETCTYYEIETEWYQQNPGVSEPQYVYSTFRVESECVTTCDNDPDPPFCEQFPDLCNDGGGGGGTPYNPETDIAIYDKCAGLDKAWENSLNPDGTAKKETNGFIYIDSNGNQKVVILPQNGNTSNGTQWTNNDGGVVWGSIYGVPKLSLPGDSNYYTIVATFHTHPNAGSNWIQGPSQSDLNNPSINHDFLNDVMDFIIASQTSYGVDYSTTPPTVTTSQFQKGIANCF